MLFMVGIAGAVRDTAVFLSKLGDFHLHDMNSYASVVTFWCDKAVET